MIDGVSCIKVEMDMDYYKDTGAHIILEVIPNGAAKKLKIGPGLTSPRMIYAMRWTVGKNQGREFDPLYDIAVPA